MKLFRGKTLHCIHSANSSSTTVDGHTIVSSMYYDNLAFM